MEIRASNVSENNFRSIKRRTAENYQDLDQVERLIALLRKTSSRSNAELQKIIKILDRPEAINYADSP